MRADEEFEKPYRSPIGVQARRIRRPIAGHQTGRVGPVVDREWALPIAEPQLLSLLAALVGIGVAVQVLLQQCRGDPEDLLRDRHPLSLIAVQQLRGGAPPSTAASFQPRL